MATPPPPPQHVPPKKSNTWLWVLLGGGLGCLVICGGLLGLGGWFAFNKYKEFMTPVTELNEAIKAKNYTQAYALMTPEYQLKVDPADFEAFFKANSAIFPGTFQHQHVNAKKTGTSSAQAKITGTMTGSKGSKTVTFTLITHGNTYKIDRISIDGGDESPQQGVMTVGRSLAIDKRMDKGKLWKIHFKGAVTQGFKTDSAGNADMELDIACTAPDGKLVIEKKGLLNYRANLGKGAKVTWTVVVDIPKPLKPNLYELQLTVHDKLAGMSITKSYKMALTGGPQKGK